MKIIADACNNHENKWDNIVKMTDQLDELGIDYIKFQIFTADKLNPDYPDVNKWHKIYKEYELSEPTIKSIWSYCQTKNIEPLFTLFDVEKAEMLRKYSDIVKIASPDCNNWKLLDVVFKLFDKVIISTGMHTVKEVEIMLNKYKKYHKKIVLLYCKSQYPAEYTTRDIGKRFVIEKLCAEYKTDFGISDHGAYPSGCDWYEHHFTLEKTGKKDDEVSWTIEEFADFLGIGDEYQARLKYKTRWV